MIDSDEFRQVLGSFATGVTAVTFPSEPAHGLTANAFSSVSLDPPLVLVCVDHDTKSHELLNEGVVDSFCVNILSAEQQHLGEFFANMTDLEEDPFVSDPTTTAVTGAPIFEESLAFIDCVVWDEVPAGDHTIYIGEVQDAAVLDPSAAPITFFQGEWGTVS